MTSMIGKKEAGMPFGIEVNLKRPSLHIQSDVSAKVWLSLSSDSCAPMKLKFDRAGHNHYDGLFSYCFKLPSGEELWIEFSDELTTAKRLEILREFMEW